MKVLKMKLCHDHKRGFTLIELVLTIVVVAIIAVPLSLVLFQHIQSTLLAGDDSMALNLARFEMEKVNNTSYTSLVSASFPNYQGYNYDCTRTVAFVQGTASTSESLKQVKVDVKKAGTTTILVSLVTYVARNVSYGL